MSETAKQTTNAIATKARLERPLSTPSGTRKTNRASRSQARLPRFSAAELQGDRRVGSFRLSGPVQCAAGSSVAGATASIRRWGHVSRACVRVRATSSLPAIDRSRNPAGSATRSFCGIWAMSAIGRTRRRPGRAKRPARNTSARMRTKCAIVVRNSGGSINS